MTLCRIYLITSTAKVFENRVLSRIFGPQKDEVTGGSKKNSKYNQNDQVKEDEIGRACSKNAGEEECM
jgi:hypothetical protein